MIARDQPKIFQNKIICGVSCVSDGNMKFGINDNRLVRSNQESFFNNFGINVDDAVLCKVSYNTDKFTRYYEVDHSNFNKEADALVTKNNKIAIYLPLADCIGAIFFDDETNSIMISHLGRHNIEQYGGAKCVNYFCRRYALNSNNIKVWLSPSPGKKKYPLRKFNGNSLKSIVKLQLLQAGIKHDNIEISNVDTTDNKGDYYSHSEFLKKNRKEDGRYLIFAMLK